MPLLTWPHKHLAEPAPAALRLDSVVYPHGCGYPDAAAENRLFQGDNLGIMAALLPDYEGRVQLIYADPPFFTNRKYAARIGRGEDSRKPAGWQLSDGYQDNWSSLDGYLQFLYERLALMVRLLAPNGMLYLHLDWHADAYARLLLDELLGPEKLVNEIIWVYHGPSPIRTAFSRKHDMILAYARGGSYIFNADAVREPYNPSTVNTFKSSAKAGFGKIPDLARGKVPEDWWYFPVVARLHTERTGYPTQKPEALLERIILASSNPGDLVADFFCGSGTTPAVAARTGRRFLAADSSRRAIHTTRSRLAGSFRPFSVEEGSAPASHRRPPRTRVLMKDGRLTLDTPLELDYWEVDPAWQGGPFRSAAQAVRPVRSGRIPLALEIKNGRDVRVRMVTVQGETYQLDVEAVADAADGL
ncbi:MAG: DNA-methyltransferase [Bacteroidota bacterium]